MPEFHVEQRYGERVTFSESAAEDLANLPSQLHGEFEWICAAACMLDLSHVAREEFGCAANGVEFFVRRSITGQRAFATHYSELLLVATRHDRQTSDITITAIRLPDSPTNPRGPEPRNTARPARPRPVLVHSQPFAGDRRRPAEGHGLAASVAATGIVCCGLASIAALWGASSHLVPGLLALIAYLTTKALRFTRGFSHRSFITGHRSNGSQLFVRRAKWDLADDHFVAEDGVQLAQLEKTLLSKILSKYSKSLMELTSSPDNIWVLFMDSPYRTGEIGEIAIIFKNIVRFNSWHIVLDGTNSNDTSEEVASILACASLNAVRKYLTTKEEIAILDCRQASPFVSRSGIRNIQYVGALRDTFDIELMFENAEQRDIRNTVDVRTACDVRLAKIASDYYECMEERFHNGEELRDAFVLKELLSAIRDGKPRMTLGLVHSVASRPK